MSFGNSVALFLSGGIMVGFILLSEIGFRKSIISRKWAAALYGLGIAISGGIFIYFGVSSRDLFGSLTTGIIAGFVAGVTAYIFIGRRWKKQ
jgi:hypothetical protein